MRKYLILPLFLIAIIFLSACGGGAATEDPAPEPTATEEPTEPPCVIDPECAGYGKCPEGYKFDNTAPMLFQSGKKCSYYHFYRFYEIEDGSGPGNSQIFIGDKGEPDFDKTVFSVPVADQTKLIDFFRTNIDQINKGLVYLTDPLNQVCQTYGSGTGWIFLTILPGGFSWVSGPIDPMDKKVMSFIDNNEHFTEENIMNQFRINMNEFLYGYFYLDHSGDSIPDISCICDQYEQVYWQRIGYCSTECTSKEMCTGVASEPGVVAEDQLGTRTVTA
ncbi:MAG: hypothetical protein KKF44_06860 [Nanoarchaeota archaeon]|nr:hypothetical protein [Nanoarchaeota archaeon]